MELESNERLRADAQAMLGALESGRPTTITMKPKDPQKVRRGEQEGDREERVNLGIASEHAALVAHALPRASTASTQRDFADIVTIDRRQDSQVWFECNTRSCHAGRS